MTNKPVFHRGYRLFLFHYSTQHSAVFDFTAPFPMYFGIEFQSAAIAFIVILHIVNSVQAIGDFSATSTKQELKSLLILKADMYRQVYVIQRLRMERNLLPAI